MVLVESNNLDLLPPSDEIVYRNSGYSSHFHIIDHGHQFVQETKRQSSVFHTVNGQSSSCLFVSILQIGNYVMFDILLLLGQEVEGYTVQCVASKFVVTENNLNSSLVEEKKKERT